MAHQLAPTFVAMLAESGGRFHSSLDVSSKVTAEPVRGKVAAPQLLLPHDLVVRIVWGRYALQDGAEQFCAYPWRVGLFLFL